MEDDRHSLETPTATGELDTGQGDNKSSAFLRQLIAFPGSQSVGPLLLLPTPVQSGAVQSDPVSSLAATAGEPVASIVEQAASVLDEEMARGVLAARSSAGTAPGAHSNAANPVLRQMHEFVDNLAALWPNLQGGLAKGSTTSQRAASDAEPLAKVSPRAPVKPGERATISMTLRNSESQPVSLVPTVTDLLGNRSGRIPSALFEFTPSEIALKPQEQKKLAISATIPVETAPGRYSGLLVVRGLDYLLALITIEVAGTAASVEKPPTSTHSHARGSTPGTMSSATVLQMHSPRSTMDLRHDRTDRGPPQEGTATSAATQHSGMMQEATRLAQDGELGNSDAIRLLQIPHNSEDVREVLARFDQELTREAKSKLTLEAFAPLPEGVNNQRYEPIFDKYPITGETYTTASGTVVLKEISYYNGEMVLLFGECPNVAQIREDLAGSGYKPLIMRHADGRESAVAQFWAHNLTDTSLGPYDASFLIVVAVPDDTPADRACFAGHENGVSSVLPVFDGTFDPSKAEFENRARLFFVRLLDSTQVAIEVGRERMGTDKRPGTVQIRREGKRRSFSVSNGAGNTVATVDFVISDDPNACLPELAEAAATAGIPLRTFPAGTEYVYPSVARIGAGPVVNWQWRTDLLSRLQRVEPSTLIIDSRSEEGAILTRWGFEPKLLGYIPNVRGVVTGLPPGASRISQGFENSEPPVTDEEIDKIVRGFLAVQAHSAADQNRPLRRGTHAKGVCVRGVFEVLDVAVGRDPALAARLSEGLFAKPGSYPVTVRFANSDPSVASDWVLDVRGLSFTVELGGAGAEGQVLRQDYSLQSAPTLPFNDVHAFVAFATVSGAADEAKALASLPLRDQLKYGETNRAIVEQKRQPVRPYQKLRYWSNVPFRHGSKEIVKYSALPAATNAAHPLERGNPNALSDELTRHLECDATMSSFDFTFQFLDVMEMTYQGKRRDPAFWIENASVEWPEAQAPFHSVARLTLLPHSRLSAAECEAMYIDVNRNSAAWSEPVGGVNRARAYAEAASREARRADVRWMQ